MVVAVVVGEAVVKSPRGGPEVSGSSGYFGVGSGGSVGSGSPMAMPPLGASPRMGAGFVWFSRRVGRRAGTRKSRRTSRGRESDGSPGARLLVVSRSRWLGKLQYGVVYLLG